VSEMVLGLVSYHEAHVDTIDHEKHQRKSALKSVSELRQQ
jgi:hypothetical protein